MSKLDNVTHITAEAMDRIIGCFKPGSKITVLVRTPDLPDCDYCMTDDDLAEVAQMIERRRASGATKAVIALVPVHGIGDHG